MKFSKLIFTIITGLFISCSHSSKMKVDLIVSNTQAYLVDADFSTANCLIINDGKIVAAGDFDELAERYESAQMLDAKGAFIYPGFHDAHCHFFSYGVNCMKYADLTGTKNPEEIYERIKAHYAQYGGDWVLGSGWDQNDWDEIGFPDNSRLNELFPDVPVFLERIDGHAGWCNSKALELAEISSTTKVEGGEILLKDGQPTGILIDRAAISVAQLIPNLTKAENEKSLQLAQANCFAVGLTSVTDCGLDKDIILLMDEMQQAGRLKMRVNAMISPTEENLDYFMKQREYKTDYLHVNTVKLYADGALGSRGALLIEDYSDDPGNHGLHLSSEESIKEICKLAFENNYQVATHAIGDAGNREVLDIYSALLKGKNDRRWRIEHAQVFHPDDFDRLAAFSVIPSVQATHCTSDMYWAVDRLGEDRLKGAYAYEQLLQQNGWLPNGTDFPVENINPMYTFCASVFRQDANDFPEGGFQIENALSRQETLRSMTIWAAKAGFEEEEKGCLEPGKWADFVLMDIDLMTASRKQIHEAKILKTYSSGELVYSAK
ncbi:amidohydrolase [Mangrovibacterium lignilyticum]|uniref:amidohydrolase n=1 Tax=Mangrovibacterium lignilyticum TaxID=2668052 RepID=UPI0013D1E6B7|nr:amidohydrolase [Mangrovibacterium lignilyticum]